MARNEKEQNDGWHRLETNVDVTELNRRKFLTYAGLAGITPALPLGFEILGAKSAEAQPAPKPNRQRRTYFFNYAHEADSGTAEYFLIAGKSRHRLRRVAPGDAALSRERMGNSFLQAVPDASITHVLENVSLPDAVTLCYTAKNPDTNAGTWSMSSMNLYIPESSVTYAYGRARESVRQGPLPMSAKRKLYGHRPAESLQDLLEERALVDVCDHASTIIGLHPNMMSGEPNSAAHIHTNYIQSNGAAIALGLQIQALGDAQPQATPNQPNSAGWATLTPLTNDETGQPFRNQKGNNAGLIQYMPDWHPAIDAIAGQAAISITPTVRNDENIGADITANSLQVPPAVSSGKLWARHDGFTTVDQSASAGFSVADAPTVKWTFTDKSVDQGLLITATVSPQGDNSIQVTITNANWYLRWIGVWLQFLDSNGTLIPVSQLPANTIPNGNRTGDTTDALFGTMVPPEFTIFAIPVDAGYSTLTFNVPPAASTVRILGSGLGTGSVDYPDTVLNGSVMTIGVNYGLTTFFLAAGASDKLSPFQKLVIVPIAQLFAQELATLLAADLRGPGISDPGTWKSIGTTLLKAILNVGAREILRGVVAGIVAIVTASEFEDAIPIAGQILRVIAAIVGVADLAHTTIDVLDSPWSYVYEMVFTHDVTVNILPDKSNQNFPSTANYYKVTALFDSGGTPHVQTIDLPSNTVSTLPPVTFKNVPRGGQINLSTGFYSRSTDPSKNDWLAAKGTTGLVSNTVDQAPDLTIEQYPVPIQSSTVYNHKQKTVLQADGSHAWLATATPPTANQAGISCGGVGTLCDFRSITVRQGTNTEAGYVGYVWKGYSSGIGACGAGGEGQFDQLANLSTGQNPQAGYVAAGCGLPDGVKMTYGLLGHSTSNFYLDSAAQIVRQIQLDPPTIAPPSAKQAWGKFNLTSTALLLHPTGKLISINNTESRIESLPIPTAAVADSDAGTKLLAQLHAGPGSRPGLIGSPAAAAISPDGVILILEQGNNRIQAFDTGANPVQFFSKQARPYFLNLTATAGGDTVYLDLAVEFSGYLYVLSYNQGSNLYRLDIYHPGQSDTTPLSTTQNFNAARLTVDFWRNVYTLNYELLQTTGSEAPPITEPSVSLWVPSTP